VGAPPNDSSLFLQPRRKSESALNPGCAAHAAKLDARWTPKVSSVLSSEPEDQALQTQSGV